MLPLLEVRIWEAEEDRAKLVLMEEVGKEFHGVGAEAGYVLVGAIFGVLRSEGADLFLNILCDGDADLHAWFGITLAAEGLQWLQGMLWAWCLPRLSVSGNFVASANNRPPNPQPISAISTFFEIALILLWSSSDFARDSSTAIPCSISSSAAPLTACAGYKLAQSMSAGLLGLLVISMIPFSEVQ